MEFEDHRIDVYQSQSEAVPEFLYRTGLEKQSGGEKAVGKGLTLRLYLHSD